jgi:molybdate transport system permease protein
VISAIALSLVVAIAGALLGAPFAIVVGLWLARTGDRAARTIVSALVLLPLVLPPVVTGLLLLRLLGRRGALGPALASIGVEVPFTTLGAVIAGLVVGLPLYVIAARTAFESIDRSLEDVAATLGASRATILRRITLPLAAPGLLAGGILAFARALGEFGATAVLAGDAPGRTRTIALAVYALLGAPGGEDAAMRLALVSIAMSVAALAAHELLLARHRRRMGQPR